MKTRTKFCKYCGETIDLESIICPRCGKLVEDLNKSDNNSVIANNNINSSSCSSTDTTFVNNTTPTINRKPKNKWIALLLCIFTGVGHKFYEGKIGMGILYILTMGLFGFGWLFDIITLLCKPKTYYV